MPQKQRCLCAWIVSLAALAVLFGGCASTSSKQGKNKDAELEWKPKPLVDWSRVSTMPVEPLLDSYRIVAQVPTEGLFPSNLGVTRVALREYGDALFGGPDREDRPVILKDPRNEFLHWNFALDDQLAISEVFPIDQFALGGGSAKPEQVVAAFRALHARLGLIYAVNELSPTLAEMIGTLYDAKTAAPVAHFHARAASILPPEPEKDLPQDLWKTDARARVRAKFQRLVYECVRELIRADKRGELETPAGWTPVGPIMPVEWPPKLPLDHDLRDLRRGY